MAIQGRFRNKPVKTYCYESGTQCRQPRHQRLATVLTTSALAARILGDVPTAGAILDRFLHHAQTIAIAGRSYRLKDHAATAGKEDKTKRIKSKPNEPPTAEPAN